MSSLLVQTQCLSGKGSGASCKVCYYSPKMVFVEWWRLGEGYESVNSVMKQLSFSVDLADEVQCRKSYHLVASTCHSRTLTAGHYTAHVLLKQDSQWLLCNDKAVLQIQSSEVDNKHSYVLFYEFSFFCFVLLCWARGVDTFLLFGCDDPAYDPSHSS